MKTFKSILMVNLFAGLLFFGNTSFAAKGESNLNIVEVASNDAQFSILVDAVVKAGLADALSAAGPYTVFAPTNDAFNALFINLGVDGIDDLTAEQLKPILLYHVVSGKVMAADVETGMVPTLNENAKLDIKAKKGKVSIDGKANVVITDIETSNGVIHVIDEVLVPDTKQRKAPKSGGC